ncbi:MAG: hypothetical protein IM565_03235 [Pseudanabaena sp. M109S1SP2A07QC]|nr:hypothetical protein [Pseudanabaena sp. M109S1SP2A07QC]
MSSKETTPSLQDTPPREGNLTTPAPPEEGGDLTTPAPPEEGNECTLNSPPLEGWQAKPDGVVKLTNEAN